MTNQFDSKGGEQNNYGVPYEAYGALAGKLAVTESALASFFTMLEEQQVSVSALDSRLRELACASTISCWCG